MLEILLALVVVGIVLYLVNTFIPMDEKIKKLVNILVILFVVLWVISALFGVNLPGLKFR